MSPFHTAVAGGLWEGIGGFNEAQGALAPAAPTMSHAQKRYHVGQCSDAVSAPADTATPACVSPACLSPEPAAIPSSPLLLFPLVLG